MALYLVTGGCGFIGSHLCEALLVQGHTVRVLDDLSTGKLENLPHGVSFIRGTVTDSADVARALDGAAGCFHLAAIASVQRCTQDWTGTHAVNLGGLIRVFEAIARMPVRIPVVYASSAAVYGDCATLPVTEDAAKCPESAYGADKYGCEIHAAVAAGVHGIPATGLRFFNVYGPRQDPESPYSGVISIFANRIRRAQPITIFGDGSQTRDFVAVQDVVSALLHAMMRPRAGAPVFNVCTGHPTTITDLAALLATLCGHPAEQQFQPSRPGEIKHSVGSTRLASETLAWSASTSLRDGLSLTLDWLASGS